MLLAVLAAFAAVANVLAVDSRTLVTTGGTLYTVSSGTAADLGLTGLDPGSYAIAWSSLAQDGTQALGVVDGSATPNPKSGLDLTFDEPTGTFAVLYKEEAAILNQVRLALLSNGAWSQVNLLPHIGFPHAFNPEMLLSHQTVTQVGDKGQIVSHLRSVLSVLWWEESGNSQARYAPIFLDEAVSSDSVTIYDLPVLLGNTGPSDCTNVPRAAYLYPAIKLGGPDGTILISFSDMSIQQAFVLRISYPGTLGDPTDPSNQTWERRRIPVVGIAATGPLAFRQTNFAVPENTPIGTTIGSSYNPTLYWSDGTAVRYTRFDGQAWSDMRSLVLGTNLTYDGAVSLLEAMAARN